MERIQVSDATLLKTIEALMVKIGNKIEEKGRGVYASNHEGLGIVTEEYKELIDAVQSNDPVDVADENFDVAVGAIWMIASLMEQEDRLKAAQKELEDDVAAIKSELQ